MHDLNVLGWEMFFDQSMNIPIKCITRTTVLIFWIKLYFVQLRYHFLVYNASVLFWQFCRPFLKPGYRQYLSISLHSVVKALDDIDDKDYEWRAQLMIALIECHVDAGRIKEAAEVSKATAEFTKAYVPLLYKQVLGLQVSNWVVCYECQSWLHLNWCTQPTF